MRSVYRITAAVTTVVAIVLAAASGVVAASDGQDRASVEADLAAPHAPDRIVVKFKGGLSRAQRAAVHAARRAEVLRSNPRLGSEVVRVPPDDLAATVAAYRADPRVAYAEPDYVAHLAYQPQDPSYSDGTQWALHAIQAPLAWDLSTGDPDVVIAIVDTGVNLDHPDLQSKLWTDPASGTFGYDFANEDSDPQDDNGHGTHVAGIAAAATDNETGIAGVGFSSRIMAVKVADGDGSAYYSDIADGVTYAVEHGARVINLSLGGYYDHPNLQDAVNYAWNAGCIVTAAAGNDGTSTPFYPAAFEKAVAVTATDANDDMPSWSNYGSYVSVAAPGHSIYSTYWRQDDPTYLYTTLAGTSMAAPHVAGLAALLLAQDPSRSNTEVQWLIETGADDLGDEGWDAYYGHGRINAYQSLGTTTAAVDPDTGGTLYSADGDLTLSFPSGAVTSTTTIVHTPQASPSNPPDDLAFANMSCVLEASDDQGSPVESFQQPYTITLTYEDADWQSTGLTDESKLNLYYWDGSQWEGVLPCVGCSLDTVNNELVAVLSHFSEFGLLGDTGGTTSVTISSFGAQGDASLIARSNGPAVGFLALGTLLIAVALNRLRSGLPRSADQ